MRPGLLLLICLGLFLALQPKRAHADEPRRADAVTEPGRSLNRALDVVLGGTKDKRTLLFLIDPTPSLQAAGFTEAFERALTRNAEALAQTGIGVAVAGRKQVLVLKPTKKHAEAAAAAKEAMRTSSKAFRNVYAGVRRAAASLSGRSGVRELVLITLENGDGEDDLESTVTSLRRAKVRFSAIAGEAYLSDSFWVSSSRTMPRGVSPGAGDGAWLALPWGWLFQMTLANETTPSGYAQYGLSRLAAETDGRIFLYAAPGGAHRCAYYGSCSFCSEDHLPEGEAFQTHRMRSIAPLVESRSKSGQAMARDPCFRALLKAWSQASKEGLLRSRPSVRLGGGVKAEKRIHSSWAPLLGSSFAFSRLAAKADKLLKTCDRIIAALETDLAKAGDAAAGGRYRAMADFTLAMLHVTRTNLVGYAAWCREVAPALLGKEEHVVEPPEITPVLEGRRVAGVSYTPLCLCHGVAPFRALRMPGGKAWQDALTQLQTVYDAFMRRYAHTPYAMALRHQGLARFHFTYRGKTVPPPPRPKTGSGADTPTTETGRPERNSGGTTGGGGGAPTTGGG